jgi:carboxypeptidase family protein
MAGDHRAGRFVAAGVAAFLFLTPVAARAQGAGVVTGHVQDAQGQALQGVTVTLLKAGQQIPPKTSGTDGNFRFADLGSGVYSASASMEGFAPVNCPGVRIVASFERHFTIKLMPATEGGPPSTCEIGEPPAQ